jgi:hypothetical protein
MLILKRENCPKVLIKNFKYIDEPEKCCELTLSFSNTTKHNIVIYLENIDEETNQILNLREVLNFYQKISFK